LNLIFSYLSDFTEFLQQDADNDNSIYDFLPLFTTKITIPKKKEFQLEALKKQADLNFEFCAKFCF